MGVAATLFGVQHLKGIEQRRSGAAQWLPGPRSIGQKDFPFRTIKSLLLLLLLLFPFFWDALYKSPLLLLIKRNDVVDVTTEISNCVRSVKEWSQMNGLKLNNIKTEFLHGSSRHRLTNPISTLNLDGTLVHSAKICRNLGVTFDDKFTLENFVSQKCRSASFGLYKIGKIRVFFYRTTTERLVHAFVMS